MGKIKRAAIKTIVRSFSVLVEFYTSMMTGSTTPQIPPRREKLGKSAFTLL
jgi:diphthamide biosynthesis methyltransferase